MFSVIHLTSWKLTPLYGFLWGFVFYLIFNYWLATFHPLAIIIAPFIKAVELLLLFPCLKAADRWLGKRRYLAMSIIYVAYTYLSQDWFAGYPYGMLGYAPYDLLPFIQIVSVTGVWGVNLLMVLPQIWVGIYLGDYISGKNRGSFRDYCTGYKADIIIFLGIIAAVLVFGFQQMHVWEQKKPDRTWKVATVQHSADSWKGGYTTYKRNFNNLRMYSLEALQGHPDIIIWSETAFVPSVAWHEKYPSDPETSALVEEFVKFGKQLPVPLVTGNPDGVLDDPNKPAVAADGSWNRKDYNSVIFFEDGKIKNTYRKQHLVPFTEYFPYGKIFPRFYHLLQKMGYHWWLEAKDPVVFSTADGVKFSTPICFEDVFGELSAQFVRNGANVIMNMTNDGWSKSAIAEQQHAAIAVYRSIENRKATIRGTNSGITCLIDPVGHIIDPMEPFKAGWHIYKVPVYESSTNGMTFFTEHDNWLAKLCVWASVYILAFAAVLQIAKRVSQKKASHD
jgi:apolipoprotein N-acyltransferase